MKARVGSFLGSSRGLRIYVAGRQIEQNADAERRTQIINSANLLRDLCAQRHGEEA